MKTVSLVLGSGGARGLAHIGVIHWLEEHGFSIRSIAGTSIGALIGGVYAAGKLAQTEQWLRSVTKLDMVALVDLSWQRSGMLRGDKLINALKDLVGDQPIEDLPITFTAVATDVRAHKEVWIQQGSLFGAIRASISIPLLFTPIRYKGMDLVDGGILNPVPIAPTFGDGTDLTVAVNLDGAPRGPEPPVAPEDGSADHAPDLQERIKHFIARFQPSGRSLPESDWGPYELVLRSFETMQSAIARTKLAAYPPDVVIEIAHDACQTLELYRAAEMIDLGYRRAQECLASLVPSLGHRSESALALLDGQQERPQE
ncbi:MAG: patatin-like phospholipase family protein [Armatimonadetes bacterium]|nr:patatin-like phospholipase family protein [Armatimonadota bacterium]